MTAPAHASVILAAGGSTRLGRPKQLLALEGEPLVRRAARAAVQAGYAPVVVVTGAAAAEVAAALAGEPVEFVDNPDWRGGVAGSVRRGLAAVLARHPDVAGVLIAVCDQPAVDAAHLSALAAALADGTHAIAASGYAGTVGVPALFDRTTFAELDALEGDQGAKPVVSRVPARVAVVALAGGERDFDTEDDWSASKGG